MTYLTVKNSVRRDLWQDKVGYLSNEVGEEIARQITPKLKSKTEDDAIKDILFDIVCLCAERFSAYESYKNGICTMPFRIEALHSPFLLAKCQIIWKSKEPGKIVYPWDKVQKQSIDVGLLFDRESRRRFNDFLEVFYCPTVLPCESGLSFAYTVCKKTPPFRLNVECHTHISAHTVQKMRQALCTFAQGCAQGHRPEGQIPWPMQCAQNKLRISLQIPYEGLLALFESFGDKMPFIKQITVL